MISASIMQHFLLERSVAWRQNNSCEREYFAISANVFLARQACKLCESRNWTLLKQELRNGKIQDEFQINWKLKELCHILLSVVQNSIFKSNVVY